MKPLIIALASLFIFLPMSHKTIEGGVASPRLVKPLPKLNTTHFKATSTINSIYVAPAVKTVPAASTSVINCGSDPNLAFIYQHESGCRTNALNPSSGAYGLCQALPGYKMATIGADWATSWATQNAWCVQYANDRYGSPYLAMLAWQQQGWW